MPLKVVFCLVVRGVYPRYTLSGPTAKKNTYFMWVSMRLCSLWCLPWVEGRGIQSLGYISTKKLSTSLTPSLVLCALRKCKFLLGGGKLLRIFRIFLFQKTDVFIHEKNYFYHLDYISYLIHPAG